jgi:hypothetical protein
MSVIEVFFDEIGFFESICTSIEWADDYLVVGFEQGIDLGGSKHPLADSLGINEPCKLIFEGVTHSTLKISKLISQPNHFEVHILQQENLGQTNSNLYDEHFYMEGSMRARDPHGWFVWDIVAKKGKIDDLKPILHILTPATTHD